MKGKIVALKGGYRTNVAGRVISLQNAVIRVKLGEWQRYCIWPGGALEDGHWPLVIGRALEDGHLSLGKSAEISG